MTGRLETNSNSTLSGEFLPLQLTDLKEIPLTECLAKRQRGRPRKEDVRDKYLQGDYVFNIGEGYILPYFFVIVKENLLVRVNLGVGVVDELIRLDSILADKRQKRNRKKIIINRMHQLTLLKKIIVNNLNLKRTMD